MPIFASQANIAGFSQKVFLAFSCDFRSSECVFASLARNNFHIASDSGVCDSNRIAHCSCIARFGPLRLTRKLKKLIPLKYFFTFAFVLLSIGTDDLSHSCPHRYFTPNFTFAFAFVILKVTNSEIILFCFALISVSMVFKKFSELIKTTQPTRPFCARLAPFGPPPNLLSPPPVDFPDNGEKQLREHSFLPCFVAGSALNLPSDGKEHTVATQSTVKLISPK